MLCSQNSGKYLSREWHEKVEKAVQDIAYFDSSDLTFLEMDGTLQGPVGKWKQFESTMRMKTMPIDPETHAEDYIYNIENPAVGD